MRNVAEVSFGRMHFARWTSQDQMPPGSDERREMRHRRLAVVEMFDDFGAHDRVVCRIQVLNARC